MLDAALDRLLATPLVDEDDHPLTVRLLPA
jgi:hypothetical protein